MLNSSTIYYSLLQNKDARCRTMFLFSMNDDLLVKTLAFLRIVKNANKIYNDFTEDGGFLVRITTEMYILETFVP